jgi:hypothetical protein
LVGTWIVVRIAALLVAAGGALLIGRRLRLRHHA